MEVRLVSDGDDTLWMNEWQYSQAVSRFFDRLYDFTRGKAPNRLYLSNRFQEIDGELMKKWGVKRGRLAESMVLLYKDVIEWANWRFGADFYSAEHEKEIREIGDLPFDYTKLEWLPEAKSVLRGLKDDGYKLCLLTCYDNEVFIGRRKFLGLDEIFHNIRATEYRKTKEDFIAVSGWTPEDDQRCLWIAVGNADSDLSPALEISENWFSIRIPHGSTSKFCEDKGKSLEGRFHYFMPPPFIHPRSIDICSWSKFDYAIQRIAALWL